MGQLMIYSAVWVLILGTCTVCRKKTGPKYVGYRVRQLNIEILIQGPLDHCTMIGEPGGTLSPRQLGLALSLTRGYTVRHHFYPLQVSSHSV